MPEDTLMIKSDEAITLHTENEAVVLATKEDIARLEAKIDQMTRVFEELGSTFETQIKGFLNGPMGKLFGKLADNGRSDASA